MSVVGTALKRAMEGQGKTIDRILDQPEDQRAVKSSSEISTSRRIRYGLLSLVGTVVMTALFTTVAIRVINIKRGIQASALVEETPVVHLANWVQPVQSPQHQDQPASSLPSESSKAEQQPDPTRIEHHHAG